MTNRLILVDTSVWVDYLRHGTSREAEVLDRLLSLGLIVTCDPIKAEIVSGAVTKSEFQKLRSLLDSLVFLKAPDNIWRSIEEERFMLARKGLQASLIDLWIAIIAKENNALIWTLDKDFLHIVKAIHFEYFVI